ncbi:DUF917 domain-containing protein [Embleya hyalina]|uniref:DUF917 domain-containing protein n=1 Tax=Embleya hyalina TaxID=516124 RepID=A0A401YF42_9ACTN|nr:DUF917 domain-containing protein [Embleya hyalina]GCD93212.1 hypothetical protein EHYA_00855 [Embleya hyalina]
MELDAGLLPDFARGCAVLGSGGGGSTAVTLAGARQAVAEHGPVRVLRPADLPADAAVMTVGTVGSSPVMGERLGGLGEARRMVDRVTAVRGRAPVALMSSEIGGSNGCVAVTWAARVGLPLLDADSMGRAFPRMDQNVLELAAIPATPAVLADERGRTVVVDHADGPWLERVVRGVLNAFGGQAACADYPLTAGQVARHAVPGSIRRALAVGAALADGVPEDPSPVARRVVTGKIAAIERPADPATGILVEGLGRDAGRLLRIEAQTEFLAVLEDGRPVVVTPDIIALVDTRTGEALQVEALRYGLRVSVLALECAPAWRTEAGLRLGGPAAFGLDLPGCTEARR